MLTMCVFAPSAEVSSVLRAPGGTAEVGAAGGVAAAVVGRWGHHAAVRCLPTNCGRNFTLGIGHLYASLQREKEVWFEFERARTLCEPLLMRKKKKKKKDDTFRCSVPEPCYTDERPLVSRFPAQPGSVCVKTAAAPPHLGCTLLHKRSDIQDY